jgi:hypothetical protein
MMPFVISDLFVRLGVCPIATLPLNSIDDAGNITSTEVDLKDDISFSTTFV